MADLKITELSALTTVLGEDLLAIVDDPTGTAATKKIRTDDFQSGWHVGARVFNSAAIECATEAFTYLTFNSEDYDTDGIHSGTSSQLYCNTAGKYLIVGNLSWEANATNARLVLVELNRTSIIAYWTLGAATGGGGERLTITTTYDLSVDDYVELVCWQNSGSTVDIEYVAKYSPNFMMHKIG